MNKKVNNLSQIASVTRYTVTSGKSQGLNVIDCNNGVIRFLLNESNALDVMQLYHNGVNVSFLSKNAFTANKSGFDSRFEGGMLYTCGFDSVGSRDGFATHGSFHITPAEVTKIECNDEEIIIEADVRNSALFGKNLLVKRRVYTKVGSSSVKISDTLINEAYRAEDYCVLYHVNFGYPMLDEGVEIEADLSEIIPRTDWAKQNSDTATLIESPVDNKEETCYYLELNKPEISVVNKKLAKKCTVKYSGDTLPCFIEWKSMASGDYAFGLEPTTTLLDDNFEYDTIGAGEKIEFFVEISCENI